MIDINQCQIVVLGWCVVGEARVVVGLLGGGVTELFEISPKVINNSQR